MDTWLSLALFTLELLIFHWVGGILSHNAVLMKVTKRRYIDIMVRLKIGEISFSSESPLYEVTVHMKMQVLALEAAAEENVPGIGEELVHSWASSPLLDSFSVCLRDVRRQTRTMSAPSEGKHVWGPRKG